MATTDSVTRSVSASAPRSTGIGPRELVVLISSTMALMALGLDLMLPGFDAMRDGFDLGEGSNKVGQVITFYFFGLAGAQLIFGPLTDRYGRKPVLYVGIGIYIAGAAASALAPTFGLLLASRVLWGVGAAAARVVASAVIRDQFVGDEMAKALSQIMAVFMIVPVIAPTVGAGIIAVLPWQAMFWFCVVWAVIIAVWSLRLHETLDPAEQVPLGLRSAGRSFREVLSIRLCLGYTMATVCMQGVFTTYLASSELMISDIFDRGKQFPLVFGVVSIGFAVSAIANGRLVGRLGIERMVSIAVKVELVLTPVLLVLAIAGGGRPNFWLFMPVLMVVLSFFMWLMPNLNSAALIPVGHIAGSASAVTSALRTGLGAVIGGAVTLLIDDSVTPFAIAACVLVYLMAGLIKLSGGIPESGQSVSA